MTNKCLQLFIGTFGGPVVGFTDFEVVVFVAMDVHRPPAFEVVGEGAGANSTKPVLLGEVFDFYNRFHLFLADKSFSQNCADKFFLAELRRVYAELRREKDYCWVIGFVSNVYFSILEMVISKIIFFCGTLRFIACVTLREIILRASARNTLIKGCSQCGRCLLSTQIH